MRVHSRNCPSCGGHDEELELISEFTDQFGDNCEELKCRVCGQHLEHIVHDIVIMDSGECAYDF